MADIRVERKHGLGKEAALAAALQVADRLKEKAQVGYRVNGDTIEFERTGAKGRIIVSEDTVVAEVQLGLLLRPMRSLVEAKIDEYFARYMK
ncbi:MAG TPA: polyhydroxyalkanoic acid system family protein [Polyangiales bacterium]